MKLSSKVLAVIIAVVFLGGIILSNNLGWWNTSGGQGNGDGNGQGGNRQGQSQNADSQGIETHSEENEPFEGRMRGKTTFQELVDWGVPQGTIEMIIGGSIPDSSMQVSAYCQQQGLSFGHIKRSLQEEVDKIKH